MKCSFVLRTKTKQGKLEISGVEAATYPKEDSNVLIRLGRPVVVHPEIGWCVPSDFKWEYIDGMADVEDIDPLTHLEVSLASITDIGDDIKSIPFIEMLEHNKAMKQFQEHEEKNQSFA